MQTRTVAIAIDDENEYIGVAEGRRWIRCAPCSRYLRGTGSEIMLFAKQTDGRALHANLSLTSVTQLHVTRSSPCAIQFIWKIAGSPTPALTNSELIN